LILKEYPSHDPVEYDSLYKYYGNVRKGWESARFKDSGDLPFLRLASCHKTRAQQARLYSITNKQTQHSI
jgi:hypothetical protein